MLYVAWGGAAVDSGSEAPRSELQHNVPSNCDAQRYEQPWFNTLRPIKDMKVLLASPIHYSVIS